MTISQIQIAHLSQLPELSKAVDTSKKSPQRPSIPLPDPAVTTAVHPYNVLLVLHHLRAAWTNRPAFMSVSGMISPRQCS